MDGVIVDAVTEFNYLGVTLDCNLEFTKQMNNNIRRANHKIYLLSKFRCYLDEKMALNLYKAMVLPHVEFCNALLLGCSEKEKKKIQKTQNRGLKVALKRDRLYSTTLLHQEAGMLSWEARAFMALNRLMFKYKYNGEFLQDKLVKMTRQAAGTLYKVDKPNSS